MNAPVKVELGEGGPTPYLPLAEVAPLVRRVVPVDPDATYTELGVRSFNKGTFHRRTLKGAEFTWQELYRVRRNDLVFSNIMAWEGAVALALLATTGASATTGCSRVPVMTLGSTRHSWRTTSRRRKA